MGHLVFAGLLDRPQVLAQHLAVDLAAFGVHKLSDDGKAIILLCGCVDLNQRHRKRLADWLAQAWGADVVHLTPPGKNDHPGQQTLF